MLQQLLEIDRELFLFLNNLGSSNWDWFWLLVTNKWISIPFYAVLLYLVFRRFGVKGTLIVLLLIAALITATDQMANLFKQTFERPRPCRQEGVMEYARIVAEVCGKYGYFSAHASSSFGLAIFISSLLKKTWKFLPYLMFGWAALVSYSRIYVGVHYPLDTLTGMLMGLLLGYIFYRICEYFLNRYSMRYP
jgi:undecaprenyl-diphosphatase